MKNSPKVPRTVPAVLKAMDETNDEQQVELYENMLTSMFGSPILLVGGIANIVVRNWMWHETYRDTLLGSIIFILLAILFELITRLPIRARLMTHLLSILISAWFFYIIVDFYDYIGPAVLTVGFIQILIAITRPNRTMITYVSVGAFISGAYLWYFHRDMQFIMTDIYYGVQFGLFFILFILSAIVLQTNRNRQKKTKELLEEALRQKDETMSLYEEITATEEELRLQNDQLKTYNDKIVKNEEKLNYLSYFDPLTELPNRKMVMERLQLLIHLNTNRNTFYIVFIDLDDFKRVNDTMGHDAGDALLVKVAETLKNCVHKDDLAGRIGGDEFALIIQRPLDEELVLHYIGEIHTRINTIFEAHEIPMSASFGVSVYPYDGDVAIELLKCADTAMYKAKELGKNSIQFFRKEMKEEILEKIQLEKQLNDALVNNEFFLVFQPQFTMDGNNIRGFEALIRWRSPARGLVSPMEFIPQAEKTGLIIPIGRWVLLTACRLFKAFCEQYQIDAIISVNVSAVQIRDNGFIKTVMDILRETKMDARRLELEITESMLIDSVEETIAQLKELKKYGIHIALDDFGTGYSSLNYLKRLPIDTLKIDKSFVNDITADAESNQLLGDMIPLVHHLNLTVIAEGVETNEQLEFLKKIGCDYAQGYLLGRPMELENLKELIKSIIQENVS